MYYWTHLQHCSWYPNDPATLKLCKFKWCFPTKSFNPKLPLWRNESSNIKNKISNRKCSWSYSTFNLLTVLRSWKKMILCVFLCHENDIVCVPVSRKWYCLRFCVKKMILFAFLCQENDIMCVSVSRNWYCVCFWVWFTGSYCGTVLKCFSILNSSSVLVFILFIRKLRILPHYSRQRWKDNYVKRNKARQTDIITGKSIQPVLSYSLYSRLPLFRCRLIEISDQVIHKPRFHL